MHSQNSLDVGLGGGHPYFAKYVPLAKFYRNLLWLAKRPIPPNWP